MTQVFDIIIKQGLSTNLASLVLKQGEFAYTTDTKKLYLGDGAGGKIEINPSDIAALTAQKLATARLIKVVGDGTGQASFDGSADASITLVLKNSGVAAGTYTKLTVDAKGIVTSATQITAADIPTLTLAKISDAGTAAGKNVGTAAGNVPLLDASGKLPESTLPAIAITEVFEAATQAAMLALTAQTGDVCVRSDLNKSYILKTSPASTLANWIELRTPTDAVLSINGRTGAITLTAADVGLGNVTNESKATMFTNAALTGDSTAKTQAASDNSTKIATTAYVQSQNYLKPGDVISGGVF